jgi:ubiquinone/menaquinone biosynthesis C-methylase UbiE
VDQITKPRTYLLGHSEDELRRLERQAEIFSAETEDVLRRAGIGAGMKVLDIGCGVGDVAMIAARLVGPTGSVLGIDNAETALRTAEARAARSGFSWLEFAEADIYGFQPAEQFDAVTGRFILMHVRDAVGAVKAMARYVKPGGVLAFLEMDISQAGAIPEMPLLRRCVDWIVSTYYKVGVEPNMGSALYATFRAAGLDPRLTGTTRIESGPDSVAYDFTAGALKTLTPAMERYGIASATEVAPETIAQRLREEAIAGDHCILMPRLIGAWARTNTARQVN